jgi:hypothetical protein
MPDLLFERAASNHERKKATRKEKSCSVSPNYGGPVEVENADIDAPMVLLNERWIHRYGNNYRPLSFNVALTSGFPPTFTSHCYVSQEC